MLNLGPTTDLMSQTTAYLNRVYSSAHQTLALFLLTQLALTWLACKTGFLPTSISAPLGSILLPSVVTAVLFGLWRPCLPLTRYMSALVFAYFGCAIGVASGGAVELRHVVLLSLLLFRDSGLLLVVGAAFFLIEHQPGLTSPFSSHDLVLLPEDMATHLCLVFVVCLGVYSNYHSKQEILATALSQALRIRKMQTESHQHLVEQEIERTQLELVLHGVERAGSETRAVVNRLFSLLRVLERRLDDLYGASSRLSAIGQQARHNVHQFQSVLDLLHHLTAQVQVKGLEGSALLLRLHKLFGFIVDQSGQISEDFRGCSAQAEDISKIVGGIELVTRQTRLLSLNAAVEAEKAGELGRGFGVLAKEIRQLAQQTELFLKDIEVLLREIQGAVSLGAAGVEQFVEEVRRSSDSTNEVVGQLDRVLGEGKAVEPIFLSMEQALGGQLQSVLEIARLTDEADEINRSLGQKTKEFARAVSDLEVSIFKVSTLAGKSSVHQVGSGLER